MCSIPRTRKVLAVGWFLFELVTKLCLRLAENVRVQGIYRLQNQFQLPPVFSIGNIPYLRNGTLHQGVKFLPNLISERSTNLVGFEKFPNSSSCLLLSDIFCPCSTVTFKFLEESFSLVLKFVKIFFSLLNRIITYQGIYHGFLIPVPLQITGEMVEIEERHLKVMTRLVSVDKIQYSNKYEGVGATKCKQL